MKAIRYDRYGSAQVLQLVDVEPPVAARGEVLVRVEAASLNPLDWKVREGALRLVPIAQAPPRITGVDFAGVVTALGAEAGPAHRLGQRVFGIVSPLGRGGTCAQACAASVQRLAEIPEGLGFETAACLPVAAGEAVQGLVDVAEVGPGQRVLIVGAAGGVGHFAVQMARHLGAQVTGVCGPANVEFVKRLGAEHVLDHRKSAAASWGRDFDLVYDVAGVLDWRRAARLLRRGGLYIGTSGTAGAAMFTGLGSMLAPIVSGTRARNVNLRADTAALVRLAELAARGVLKPHVAERIGLAEVPRAQAAMQRGHGRGKIVVLPQQGTA